MSERRSEAGGRRDAPPGQLPRLLVVPALLGIAMLAAPIAAFGWRLEWATIWSDLTSPDALEALGLSALTALTATAVCLVIGVPLALWIVRAPRWLGGALRAVAAIPLLMPPLVGGLALLALLGPDGALGGVLGEAGVSLPSTAAAVVVAQIFVALPFVVFAAENPLRAHGAGPESAAAGLGAGRWRILFRVTLPLAAPGIVVGAVLCFVRAAGEFGATALFAGDAPGATRTAPLAVYDAFAGSGGGQGAAATLALLLIVLAIATLVLVRAWRPGAVR
ncbi:molybdate ABC transporter permease subunit [Microbacterium halophytorum]|uniref:molybdate ABC transporter permease subunit n=1 Tax=Microbacterium halophytorum TaxID=2067568 RepID=UPI000CFDBE28|nr:ABC transporter permease subunit [Microbacterium halophytorum]